MNAWDRELAQHLEEILLSFDKEKRPLYGIHDPEARQTLLEQMVESIHRVKYVSMIQTRQISARRADPNDGLFDPLKAAVVHKRQGNIDEAYWLVFLFVHFGKHVRGGWRYAREVYGRLGDEGRWDWARTSMDPAGFRTWLNAHQDDLRRKGVPRGFGNHRKYESLDAYSSRGTGAAVESYVRWIAPPRTHLEVMEQAYEQSNGDSRKAFDVLYKSMAVVASFGRTARFDYLTMVGKLGLAPIEPGSTYMEHSTGPVRGARLLLAGNETATLSPTYLDKWLVELDVELQVGMQVLEDALCNWQKSPRRFIAFRG